MRKLDKETKEIQGTLEASREVDPVEMPLWDGQRLPAANKIWPPHIQEEWNRLCRDLQSAGYLARSFLNPLKRYCFAIMLAEEAEMMLTSGDIVEEGEGSQKQTIYKVSEWMKVWKDANRTMLEFGREFGLTPLAASKIPKVVKDKKDDESLLE
jgi:P27 family predicted phage terminase small subunit